MFRPGARGVCAFNLNCVNFAIAGIECKRLQDMVPIMQKFFHHEWFGCGGEIETRCRWHRGKQRTSAQKKTARQPQQIPEWPAKG